MRRAVIAGLAILSVGCTGSAEKAAQQYAESWNAGDIDAVWEQTSSAWRSRQVRMSVTLGGSEEEFKDIFSKNQMSRELKVVKVEEEKHVATAEFLLGSTRLTWELIEEDDGKWRVKPH